MDETGEQLELMVAEGASGIRVPVGKGIAGTVAQKGELENIQDAYKDDRFDPSFDKKSGYRTESVLAAPVRDGQGQIVGVLQVINKLKNLSACRAPPPSADPPPPRPLSQRTRTAAPPSTPWTSRSRTFLLHRLALRCATLPCTAR